MQKWIIKKKILIIVTAVILSALNIHACSSAVYHRGDPQMKRIEDSPNYKEGKFRNYHDWEQPSFGEYLSTGWEFLFGGDQRTPESILPRKSVDLKHFSNSTPDQLNVTWLGHSSLMINIDGYKILTDPVFEKSVSFFGPSRYNGDVPVDTTQLPKVDIVIISHNHYDHLNKTTIELLAKHTGLFIVPLAVGAELEDAGVQREKIVELDWWEEYNADQDLLIVATPAQHFSGRGLTDRDETLWASWVIKATHHKIYFSGDSGYFDGFKKIGEKYGPFDMTFLETGAYNEKWHHIHMFPEETVQAHLDLGGNILHPIHWATFNLSLHTWYDPMDRLTKTAEEMNVTTATPIVGETTIYGEYIPTKKWWESVLVDKKEQNLSQRRDNVSN
jgi:L-ascorbate metabolism protein UlaG (beta-lactamase superfamily)